MKKNSFGQGLAIFFVIIGVLFVIGSIGEASEPKSNELHYKIWCIENGRYTREVWYNLMTASLNEKYRTLLDEILA